MKRGRLWRCLIMAILFIMLLTSCGGELAGGPVTTEPTTEATSSNSGSTSSPVAGGGAFSCVDFVWFANPQDQYDNAGLVLIGKPVSKAGEITIYGHPATTHLMEVEQILKGNPGEGNFRITSTPETCTPGGSYPDGDPLDTAERVLIFANNQGGQWFTTTPTQGVVSFPPRSELPFH